MLRSLATAALLAVLFIAYGFLVPDSGIGRIVSDPARAATYVTDELGTDLLPPLKRAIEDRAGSILSGGTPADGQSQEQTDLTRIAVDDVFVCRDARVTDGDTIRCGDLRVRLASIDAPEMPGSCRQGRTCVAGDPHASKANLERLMGSGTTRCRKTDMDRYGRTVALCSVNGADLSCAQVQSGNAEIRYGKLTCPSL